MSLFRRLGTLAALAVLSLVLASCSIGGGDEGDPTPTETAEQVSLEAESTATVAPTETEASFVLVTPTFPADDSTPEVPDPSGPSATIVDDVTTPQVATPDTLTLDPTEPTGDPSGTPASDEDEGSDSSATPQSTTGETGTTSTTGTGSDGTSGAPTLPEADATPVNDVATPESTANAIEVDSCDVVEVPPYAGATTTLLTTEDVNFRVGPGSDCASVLDGPLGPNVAVDVVGGPVIRTDAEDGVLWVQVIVGDDTGWIAQDFLIEADSN